jgi:hypothetical protein
VPKTIPVQACRGNNTLKKKLKLVSSRMLRPPDFLILIAFLEEYEAYSEDGIGSLLLQEFGTEMEKCEPGDDLISV